MKPLIFTRNRQRRLRVKRAELVRLAARLLESLNSPLEELGIILVSDAQMAAYNERFHRRRGPTDILAFDYNGRADLVISTEQALSNARRYRTTARSELARYVIHGILHLHGYEDCTPAQRRRMRTAERRYLRRFFSG